MIKHLIKNNIKIIRRSPVCIFAYLFLSAAFLFFWFHFAFRDGYCEGAFYIFDHMAFFEIALCLVVFIFGVYFSHMDCLLEDVCFIPKQKTFAARLAAVNLTMSAFVLLPIALITITACASGMPFDFAVATVIYAVILWLTAIVFMTSVGFTVGYLVKFAYAYLFAIPFAMIHTYLNNYVYQALTHKNSPLTNLFSLQSGYFEGVQLNFRGPFFDAFFLLRVVFFLFLGAAWVALLMIVCKRKPTVVLCSALVLCIALSATVGSYCMKLNPIPYDDDELYISDYEEQKAQITSFSGKIKLGEWLSYRISIGIRSEEENIRLRLDESMKIKSLTVDGRDLEYVRDGDDITFVSPSESFTIDISARGRVSYVNDVSVRNIYTSLNGCCLPAEFAFLPRIDGDFTKKDYDLTVSSRKFLATNLEYTSSGNEYTLHGSAETLFLISGYLTTFEYNGVRFYTAEHDLTLTRDDYVAIYEKWTSEERESLYFNPKLGDYETGHIPKDIKTVFISSFYYPSSLGLYEDFAFLPDY